MGHLTNQLTLTAAGPALMERSLQYDPASRIIQRGTEAGAFNYTYDKASRLTGATPPVALQSLLPTEAYTYDATGNRTSSARQPGAWATNAEHQLLQWGSAANQVNLQYNPNGNLQTQIVGGQTRTHSYDAADRLIDVRDAADRSAQYGYDLKAGASARLQVPRPPGTCTVGKASSQRSTTQAKSKSLRLGAQHHLGHSPYMASYHQ